MGDHARIEILKVGRIKEGRAARIQTTAVWYKSDPHGIKHAPCCFGKLVLSASVK